MTNDDPEYWFAKYPGIEEAEALSSAFWAQTISAVEMWEHLGYLQSPHPQESPYFTSNSPRDQEKRAMAPLILKFLRFSQVNHPNIQEQQLRESIRATMYDPGVINLIQLLDRMSETHNTSSPDVNTEPPWYDQRVSASE
jgi:hypothetical protein